MKVTVEFLKKEAARINPLLSWIDMEVKLVGKGRTSAMAVTDLQGANYGDVEAERFFTAHDVAERLRVYFDDVFLDGEICCNADHNFTTYQEAAEEALARGYDEIGDAIQQLIDILAEPETEEFFDAVGNRYVLPAPEIEAAFRHAQHQYYVQDAKKALARLIYGVDDPELLAPDELIECVSWFEDHYGMTVDDTSDLADIIAERLEDEYDCNVSFNDQIDNITSDVVSEDADWRKLKSGNSAAEV